MPKAAEEVEEGEILVKQVARAPVRGGSEQQLRRGFKEQCKQYAGNRDWGGGVDHIIGIDKA